ncbi:PhzF family phenazine biosynthesis protein [Leptolyngbya sp. NIES-2104]|uniref:PhzF family phenazine biosynthesis protein n=1 Tax=Leptolyngbya sp. NIES-2104 TaxID=1552121 RepID=UPI0006EC8A49|nr:PhzF family phenazine biosynthesis protein [Leptolyngbya sp. NIES-2104]GAP99310.1 phenazine biosynthesis protein PhzF like [Leptolyngbya sp. NIES-2104]
MTLQFYIVDVFAERKYAGNQLAVFRVAASLKTEEMQAIAKEMNYSETTFILSEFPQNGGYPVRIFTPDQELPFAGHPTLGTAFVLQQSIIQESVSIVKLNLAVGQIAVTLNYAERDIDALWMRQNAPEFGQRFDPKTIAPVLGLSLDQIDDRTPIEEVSTGLPFIIVPLKNLEALQQANVDRAALFKLVESTEAKAILIFCPETRSLDNQLSVRVFVEPLGGPPEDPATGSANGCLAAYLVQYAYFGQSSIDIQVEQGYEIGRPSLLMLRAKKENEAFEISVGGNVILVAQGEFV